MENSELGVGGGVLRVPDRFSLVKTSSLKPFSLPFIETRRSVSDVRLVVLLKGSNEVVQGGVAPSVLSEISVKGLSEVLFSDKSHELSDGGSTLVVGDTIENSLGHIGVLDLTGNRVGGDQLILVVTSFLTEMVGCPRVDMLDSVLDKSLPDLALAVVADEFSETFIEPEIVPPFHGNQVAEPLMGNFVSYDVGSHCVHVLGDLLLPDETIVIDDESWVFHSTHVIFSGEDSIALSEGVGDTEVIFVELDGFLVDQEDLVGLFLEVRHETLSGKDAHADVVIEISALDFLVITSTDTVEIGTDLGSSGVDFELVVGLFFGGEIFGNIELFGGFVINRVVCDDVPFLG